MVDRSGEEEWPILKRILTTGRDDGCSVFLILVSFFCFVLKIVCFLSFYSCAVWSSAETGESQDFGCHAVCQRSIG